MKKAYGFIALLALSVTSIELVAQPTPRQRGDRRENVRDRREDVRDRREDVRDRGPRHHGYQRHHRHYNGRHHHRHCRR